MNVGLTEKASGQSEMGTYDIINLHKWHDAMLHQNVCICMKEQSVPEKCANI